VNLLVFQRQYAETCLVLLYLTGAAMNLLGQTAAGEQNPRLVATAFVIALGIILNRWWVKHLNETGFLFLLLGFVLYTSFLIVALNDPAAQVGVSILYLLAGLYALVFFPAKTTIICGMVTIGLYVTTALVLNINPAVSISVLGSLSIGAAMILGLLHKGVGGGADLYTGLPQHYLFYQLVTELREDKEKTVLVVELYTEDKTPFLNQDPAVIRKTLAKFREHIGTTCVTGKTGENQLTLVTYKDVSKAKSIKNLLEESTHCIGSGGVSTYIKHENWERAYSKAQSALQLAKNKQEHNLVFLTSEVNELEKSIQEALLEREMAAYFQPIISLKNGHIVGFETLVRWEHPQHGVLTPSVFLAFVKDNKLTQELNRLMLLYACKFASKLDRNLWVSVNLEPEDFTDPTLLETLQNLLEHYKLSPSQIRLELTEQTELEVEMQTVLNLANLEQLGVKVLLDDFGTGHSSIDQLRKLSLGGIKIAQSFLDDKHYFLIRESRPKPTIEVEKLLYAMVNMGTALGMSSIAEGVETLKQVELCVRTGTDMMQGYVVSKALPFNAALAFADKEKLANNLEVSENTLTKLQKELVLLGDTETHLKTEPYKTAQNLESKTNQPSHRFERSNLLFQSSSTEQALPVELYGRILLMRILVKEIQQKLSETEKQTEKQKTVYS